MKPQHVLPLALLAPLAAPALAQAPVYTFTGIAPDDRGGNCVAGVGDLDGDGVGDIALGLPYADPAGSQSGRLHVHSGKTGAMIRTYLGQQAGEQLGASVAAIGDIDGDGVSDLIIGAPLYDINAGTTNVGRAYIFSGQGQLLTSFVGGNAGDQLGQTVAGVGDVDGDGVPDFAYGAPFADPNGPSSGQLTVRSGASGNVLFSVIGTAAGDQMGWAIAGIGDIDGDGRDDVAVGAPGFDHPLGLAQDMGRVTAYAWAPTGTKQIFSSVGSWLGGQYGYALDGVGDLDGDGVPDLVVGAPLADANGLNSGEVRVISGQTQAVLYTATGFASTQAGRAVANLGDMNGDGLDEIGVGLPWFSFMSSTQQGLVWALSGASGQVLHTWNGPQSGALLGFSLASAGDLNGDGRGDVVLGMPFYDTEWSDAGGAVVALADAPYPKTYCTAKVNSSGCTPKIATSGALSLSIADNFHVTAALVLAQKPGILIWSVGQASIPFGGGTLCLAPQITRTSGQSSGGSPALPCSGNYDFHFSQAYLATTPLTAGTIVYAQYWSRDTVFLPPNNMGLTDAVWFPVLP